MPASSTRGRALHVFDDALDALIAPVERMLGRPLVPPDWASAKSAKEQRELFVHVASQLVASARSALPASLVSEIETQLERAKHSAPEKADEAVRRLASLLKQARESSSTFNSLITRVEPQLNDARSKVDSAIASMREGTFSQKIMSKFDELLDSYATPAVDDPPSSTEEQQSTDTAATSTTA